jgi:hypothetical protein
MRARGWWAFACPECETSHVVPNPPFPAVHRCWRCGRVWDVAKLREAGYLGWEVEVVDEGEEAG